MYSYRRRFRRNTRGGYRRRPRTTRPRTYRKAYSRRPHSRIVRRMRRPTRRRILNVSTTKKRDAMLTARQDAGDTSSTNLVQFNVNALGFTPHAFIFSPTMRYRRANAGITPSNMTREKDDLYFRGFKENLRFATSDSNDWRWRRIVFMALDWDWSLQDQNDLIETFYPMNNGETEAEGYKRVFMRLEPSLITPLPTVTERLQTRVYNLLFRGLRNQDWSNPMTAMTDSRSVRVLYDRTTPIKSSSDAGVQLITKRWHPVNRSLSYNVLEGGKGSVQNPQVRADIGAQGDMYVLDFFQCVTDDETSNLSIGSDAIIYWHER